MTYRMFIGPIKPGYHLHHLCENPWCVNPWHLQQMTASEHAKTHDHFAGQPWNLRKTTCPRGHEYDVIWVSGKDASRGCARCHEEWKRGRREWLVATGHLQRCTKKACWPGCTAGSPVGDYHHVYVAA